MVSVGDILPHSAEFTWRDALHLSEHPGKIIGVLHAAFSSDGFHGPVREPKELFGMGDADLQQIVVDGDAELFLENAGQVKFVDIKYLCKIVQIDPVHVVMVQIVFDVLQVLFFSGDAPAVFRIPALFHQKGKQRCQRLEDPHVPYMVFRGGGLVERVQNPAIGQRVCRMETGPPAPFRIFLIDAAHVGTVKMDPFQLPELMGGAVGIGPAAVKKDAVPGIQGKGFAHIFQRAVAGQDLKEQIGGKIFSAAGMRFSGFEKAGLLQMDQAGPGKCRGGVKDSAGGHQTAMEKGCAVHTVVPPCDNGLLLSL